MGYYTTYKLEVEPKPDLPLLEYLTKDTSAYGPLMDFMNGRNNNCKWYDHDDDMNAVSTKFPDFLFILSGEGEESGDIWKKYYKGGKQQVCKAKIVFEEFDEKKLK